jgi:hypothetical protein
MVSKFKAEKPLGQKSTYKGNYIYLPSKVLAGLEPEIIFILISVRLIFLYLGLCPSKCSINYIFFCYMRKIERKNGKIKKKLKGHS